MTSLITFMKTTPTEVVPSPPIKPLNETLEILTKVNEFYDSSWNKLIWLLAGSFAVLGVLIPLIIQHFQLKSLKNSEKALENEISRRITEAKDEIKNEMSEELERQMKEYKASISFNFDSLSGLMIHSQAVNLLDRRLYFSSLENLIKALARYNRCDDKNNIIIVLDQIIICLNNLKTDEIENFKNNNFNSLMEKLKFAYDNNDLVMIKEKTKEIKKKLNSFK